MNLEELRDKSILLLGKPRAFNNEEFIKEIEFYNINLASEYNEDVVMVVDGKMMTPYEQNKSDELYELHSKELEFISIDTLERELVKHINPNTLLMSLKLSKDKERLKSFIQNSCISDELFLKLLSIYSWGGENFFDNNDNRDVSAAIILRFYKDIERNHNVEYATSGFVHLISQSDNPALLQSIAKLEPLHLNYNILSALATNSSTPKSVIDMLIKKADTQLKVLIAIREDIDEDSLNLLFESGEDEVLESLSCNKNLPKNIVEKLIEDKKYTSNLAKYQKLDDELFSIFVKNNPADLAQNSSISYEMQKKLLELDSDEVLISLASNISVDSRIIDELLDSFVDEVKFALYANESTPKKNLEKVYENPLSRVYLAGNENTPAHILEKLSSESDIEILKSLAKNKNTPVSILYQLQLDARLARAVKENPAFSEHIQSENLGWL